MSERSPLTALGRATASGVRVREGRRGRRPERSEQDASSGRAAACSADGDVDVNARLGDMRGMRRPAAVRLLGRILCPVLEHPAPAVTGFAFALASLASASNGLATWPTAVAAASVAAVTPALWAVDVREHRLPNALTGAAAIGCGLALLLDLVAGVVDRVGAEAGDVVLPAVLGALAAAAVAALVFGALSLAGGMGMGDAKLVPSLAAAAALVSLETALAAFALAFLSGGIAAIGRLVARRDRRERLAFGPYLLAGFWTAWAVAVVAPALR